MRGSVSELDADQVEVDQKLKVIFPFSNRTHRRQCRLHRQGDRFRLAVGEVPHHHSNPEGQLKAGMFVRMLLEIPPKTGRTLIPRVAMVSVDRFDYVFVKKPGKPTGSSGARSCGEGKQRLRDRGEPSVDHLGLTPGEEVVTTGSLILEQMYEDRVMTEGGLLALRGGRRPC